MKNFQICIYDLVMENVTLRHPQNKNGIKAAVSWSGGKDSTATAILAINDGYDVMMAHSFVEFAPGIPFVTKRMVDFIFRTKETFESFGATVDILHPPTYISLVTRILHKSPYEERNGKPRGYPCPGHCKLQRDFKSKPLSEWAKRNFADFEFIGICYDEWMRKSKLNEKKRSLLNEMQYTQQAARQICEINRLLSPAYTSEDRDGCGLCFNAKPNKIKEWLDDYPEALPILRDLDHYLKDNAVFGNRWGR